MTQVDQRAVAKDRNTVIAPGVDVDGDVAAINQGLAENVGETFIVNGRIYGVHNHTLYPISGPGFQQLSRPAFKALGVLNAFGNTERAQDILQRMGINQGAIEAALQAWQAGGH